MLHRLILCLLLLTSTARAETINLMDLHIRGWALTKDGARLAMSITPAGIDQGGRLLEHFRFKLNRSFAAAPFGRTRKAVSALCDKNRKCSYQHR